jgi:hypothetical protein
VVINIALYIKLMKQQTGVGCQVTSLNTALVPTDFCRQNFIPKKNILRRFILSQKRDKILQRTFFAIAAFPRHHQVVA